MQVAEETASDTLDSAVTLTAPTQSLDGDRPPHTLYASVTGVGGTRLPQSRVCPEASVAHVTESLPGLLSAIGLEDGGSRGSRRAGGHGPAQAPSSWSQCALKGQRLKTQKSGLQEHVVRAPQHSGNCSRHIQTCSHCAVTYTDTTLYVSCC